MFITLLLFDGFTNYRQWVNKYPLRYIKLIILAFLMQVKRTVMIMTAVVVRKKEKEDSHPLFIMQNHVAALHSGLFSDTVRGEIGIRSSSTMDFSPCVTVDGKW